MVGRKGGTSTTSSVATKISVSQIVTKISEGQLESYIDLLEVKYHQIIWLIFSIYPPIIWAI